MRTIILPGYSPHNRDWALEIKKDLKLGHEVLVHEWKHWPPAHRAFSEPAGSLNQRSAPVGLSFSVPREVKSILEKVGNDKVDIIAKSVGTKVAMHLVTKIPGQINKVVLCGVPTKGESDAAKKTYSKGLASLSPTQVMVFQNTKDPFASYKDIKKFISTINPKIKVVEKPRSDHHYPYSEDFEKFLT